MVKKPEPTVEELKALLAKAREALQLANDVMDYCGGDKWEREATAEDRDAFSKLYDELMKASPELIQSYKPSKKGLKHFDVEDRIIVIGKSYLWFRKIGSQCYFNYNGFDGGDVFEFKSHMTRLPDSLWEKAEMIDPSSIQKGSGISSNNRREFAEEIKTLGINLEG